MLNRDIYLKAPEQNRLANNGVAELSEDRSEAALHTLRYELETFVCDGQYEKGLELILEKFLHSLSLGAEQPGVWISGFFGSGKSHLAKMLRTLWTDYTFDDGATARVLAKLPSTVSDAFKELSTQGKRNGGLHAAGGKLGAGAGDSIRLSLLSIMFKSVGLPEQFHQAQLVMWLRREGILDAVEANLKASGRSLAQDLPHMFVSDHLARAILKAKPSFADGELAARQFIKSQFPQVSDLSSDQIISTIKNALSEKGEVPLVLVVLDEVQQYIGNDAQKAFAVQEVTETLSKHFNGRLLFVGTGQSALSGMPNLQRLMGRFPIKVTLGDWDVENVTRKIILAKKPSAQPTVEKVWRDNLGEISRHLHGTKLEHVTDDEKILTADYPILPVRRRFWERVLRSIDTTGTVSQLRSQLSVVHEATLATADFPVGHIVPADFLYDQIAPNLVATAQLPREVFEHIAKFSVGDDTAKLMGRLLRLIYLINKLPAEAVADIGLRATDEVLADLLVTDLKQGSAEIRKAVKPALDELQNTHRIIMALDGPNGAECRLQTRESSAWYDEFRAQEAELRGAAQRIEVMRTELLRTRFRETLAKVRPVQGKSKESRSIDLSFDDTLPKDNDSKIYVWVQDGWQTEEKSVIADAKSRGVDNPTIFVFLPAQHKTDLANAMVTCEAAKSTLARKGVPNTEEGRDAQRSMEGRLRNAEREMARIVDRLFAGVRVFQAGGEEVSEGSDLAERVRTAADAAIVRLFRDFDVADHEGWAKVIEEARRGNAEALKAVSHKADVDKHPVCQKIIGYIGPGKKGAEIRERFERPPCGWPRDAIDGALYALLATGHLRATDAAGTAVDGRTLERNKVTQVSFRVESVNITTPHLIEIRKVFTALGVPYTPKEELTRAPQLIAKLRELAAAAGGDAPRPERPKVEAINALETTSGNSLLLELHNRASELIALAKQWQKVAVTIDKRMQSWALLQSLVEHAKQLGPYTEIKSEMDAIVNQRSLISDPDPVEPLLVRATKLLRDALNAKVTAFAQEYEQQMDLLRNDATWKKLTDAQKATLLQDHNITKPATHDLSSVDLIIEQLDTCNLQHWVERIQALRSRFDATRIAAAKLLEPKVVQVTLPKRTFKSPKDVKQWLAEVEKLLVENLKDGPVVF